MRRLAIMSEPSKSRKWYQIRWFQDYDTPEDRKLIAKLDFLIVPYVFLAYWVKYIDQANISTSSQMSGCLTTDKKRQCVCCWPQRGPGIPRERARSSPDNVCCRRGYWPATFHVSVHTDSHVLPCSTPRRCLGHLHSAPVPSPFVFGAGRIQILGGLL